MPLPTLMTWTKTPRDAASWSTPVAVPSVQLAPLIDSNLTPYIYPNGSLIGLWRNDDDRGSVHVMFARDWRDPDTYVQFGAQTGPPNPAREDPSIWRDRNGHFHCITHSFDGCGYHSFSRDGYNWRFAPGVGLGVSSGQAASESLCTFSYTVQFEGGHRHTFDRRERPHIVLGPDGSPIALTTSVTYNNDASYTLLQPIGQHAVRHAHDAAVPAPSIAPAPAARAHLQRRKRWPGEAHMSLTTARAQVEGCVDSGGNTFQLQNGARMAVLSRTGLEGLIHYDDGSGNISNFNHDDFEIFVSEGAAKNVSLRSQQDSSSRKGCALMQAGCSGASAQLVYRCDSTAPMAGRSFRFEVNATYELNKTFVSKELSVCKLTPHSPTGGRRICDTTARVTVLRETPWYGLHSC